MGDFKGYVIGFIVGIILKFGAGFLASLGYQGQSAYDFVYAAVAGLVGVAIDIYQHKKALNQEPPAKAAPRPTE